MSIQPGAFNAIIMEGRGKPKNYIVILPEAPAPNPRLPNVTYLSADFPEGPQRHIALGSFINHWGNLEVTIAELMERLLRLKQPTAHALSSTLSMKNLTDFILASGPNYLTVQLNSKLIKLIERVSKLATKRNYLIHGRWYLEAIVHNEKGTLVLETRWTRLYQPADSATANRLANYFNTKDRAKYCFSLSDIDDISLRTVSLINDIGLFMGEAKLPIL